MEWVDGNMGAAITMKRPRRFLTGEHAAGGRRPRLATLASVTRAPRCGAHGALNNLCPLISRSSVSAARPHVLTAAPSRPDARHSKSTVSVTPRCGTDPALKFYVDVRRMIEMGPREATVTKVSADFLPSYAPDENEAMATIVCAASSSRSPRAPLHEYALESNCLIELGRVAGVIRLPMTTPNTRLSTRE